MFNPGREEVRRFFIDSWRKAQNREFTTAMENIAIAIIARHPEYHALLSDADSVEREFSVEGGELNPFLHLSLHLAIEEQLSIDQPPGIRAAFADLCRSMDQHDAQHHALESLAETLHEAQRRQTPPDGAAYLARLRKKTSQKKTH